MLSTLSMTGCKVTVDGKEYSFRAESSAAVQDSKKSEDSKQSSTTQKAADNKKPASSKAAEKSGSSQTKTTKKQADTKKSETNKPASDSKKTEQPKQQAQTKQEVWKRNVLPESAAKSLTVTMDKVSAIAGETKVPVRLMVFGNTDGFNMCGIRLGYDAKLHAVCKDTEATFDEGNLTVGAMQVAYVSEEQHKIAYALAATKTVKNNGVLATFYFDVPKDAKSGTVYQLTADIEDVKKVDGTLLSAKTANGYIVVE